MQSFVATDRVCESSLWNTNARRLEYSFGCNLGTSTQGFTQLLQNAYIVNQDNCQTTVVYCTIGTLN